jgi:hypothetical protein
VLLPIDRPFELLQLIRDGRIKKVRQLPNVGDSSRAYFGPEDVLARLASVGLLTVDDHGVIAPTESLVRIFRAIGVSLTALARFSPNSIVCEPIFGRPEIPSRSAELFVVMPFTEGLAQVYDGHIKAVAKGLGLSVARADDFFGTHSIVEDVWRALYHARVVIADCTGRNPNVFYELGIAHTLGRPVVLVSQDQDDIPFDVRHIRSLVYELTPRGMAKFEQDLASTIRLELRHHQTLAESLRDD